MELLSFLKETTSPDFMFKTGNFPFFLGSSFYFSPLVYLPVVVSIENLSWQEWEALMRWMGDMKECINILYPGWLQACLPKQSTIVCFDRANKNCGLSFDRELVSKKNGAQ